MSITITSIDLKPSSFANSQGTSDLRGHSGETIEATILYTCNDVHNAIGLWYELPINSKDKETYQYTFYKEPSLKQLYKGELNTILNPIGENGWQLGSCTHSSLGGDSYQLIHIFTIPFFSENGIDIPLELLSTESVKYTVKIESYADVYDSTSISSQKSDSLDRLGNVGFINERFNGFPKIWNLSVGTNTNVNETLNYTLTATSPQAAPYVVICASKLLYGNYDVKNNFLGNYKFSLAEGLANGTTHIGINCQFKASLINPTLLQIELDINEGYYQDEDIIIWAIVGIQAANAVDCIRNSVLLQVFDSEGTSESLPPCGFYLGTYPAATFPGFLFFYHDYDPTLFYSDVLANSEDGIVAKAKFEKHANFTLQKVKIEIVDTNLDIVFESFEFSNTIDTTRNFILAANDPFNYLKFNFDTLQLEYGFKFRWEEWIKTIKGKGTQNWANYNPNIVLQISGIGKFNNTAAQWIVRSNTFKNKDYLETTADGTKPQVNDLSIELTDEATLTVINGISENSRTLVKIICKGTNGQEIGDLLANLWGVIRLEPNESGVYQKKEFSSVRTAEIDTPFENISNLANLVSISTNEVHILGYINPEKLNPSSCYSISGRLGHKNAAPVITPIANSCCQNKIIISYTYPDNCTPPVVGNCPIKGTHVKTERVGVNLVVTYNDGDCGTYETVTNTCCEEPLCYGYVTVFEDTNCIVVPPVPNPLPPPASAPVAHPDTIPIPPLPNTADRNTTCGVSWESDGTAMAIDRLQIGVGVGTITIVFDTMYVPDRLIVQRVSDSVNVYDTGFISMSYPNTSTWDSELLNPSKYQQEFVDWWFTTYGSNCTGLPAVNGLSPFTFSFPKNNNAAEDYLIIVMAALDGTVWSYAATCNLT